MFNGFQPNELRNILLDSRLNIMISDYFKTIMVNQLAFPSRLDSGISRQELIDLVYRVYIWCAVDASGGGGGYNNSCRGAEDFKKFASQNITNPQLLSDWFNALLRFFSPPNVRDWRGIDSHQDEIQRWIDSWTKPEKIAYAIACGKENNSLRFPGMRLKTSALFIKILAKDLGFFTDFNHEHDRLFVPLDNINLRMLAYLLNPSDIPIPIEVLRKRDNKAHILFSYIAWVLMDRCNQNTICLENLWFIGHFYHENMRRPRQGGGRGAVALDGQSTDRSTVYGICRKRVALEVLHHSFFNQRLPNKCPFYHQGCRYNFSRYQQLVLNQTENEQERVE